MKKTKPDPIAALQAAAAARREPIAAAIAALPDRATLTPREAFARLYGDHVQYGEFEDVWRASLGADDPGLGRREREALAAAAPQETPRDEQATDSAPAAE